MKIQIIPFAVLTEYISEPQALEVSSNATVSMVVSELSTRFDGVGDLLDDCRIVRDDLFLQLTDQVEEGDELLILPPSSGG